MLLSKGEGQYTNKVDNWSLGVILYIILVGFPPFSEDNLEHQIKQGIYDFMDDSWKVVSGEAKDVVKKLMCINPETRATLDEILAHSWLRDEKMINRANQLMNVQPTSEAALNDECMKRSLDSSSQNSDVLITNHGKKRHKCY